MKITRVRATPLHLPVPVEINGRTKTTSLSMCLVDIETDTGLVGTGMTAITEEEVIGSIVNDIASPCPDRHGPAAPRTDSGSGCTGCWLRAASRAMRATPSPRSTWRLWDLKGQAYGEPCWRLLGGARDAGAGLCHLRIRLLRPRRTGRRRRRLGGAWFQAPEDDRGPPCAAAARRTAPAGRGDRRGRAAHPRRARRRGPRTCSSTSTATAAWTTSTR